MRIPEGNDFDGHDYSCKIKRPGLLRILTSKLQNSINTSIVLQTVYDFIELRPYAISAGKP
jgi:hypothetical protein